MPQLTVCVSMCPSVSGESDVFTLPEIRETEILDDIIPEIVNHSQAADLLPSASPPATVSLEDVALETGTEAETSATPESGARDTLSRHQSRSLSQASVDEEVVPITDIYFVSPVCKHVTAFGRVEWLV